MEAEELLVWGLGVLRVTAQQLSELPEEGDEQRVPAAIEERGRVSRRRESRNVVQNRSSPFAPFAHVASGGHHGGTAVIARRTANKKDRIMAGQNIFLA